MPLSTTANELARLPGSVRLFSGPPLAIPPLTPPAIVVAVALKPLQRAGFVAVRVDPADRRSRLLPAALSLASNSRISKEDSITKSLKEDIYDGT